MRMHSLRLLLVLACAVPTTAYAESWCERDDRIPEPQNVILFLLDDTSFGAFPYFAPPVTWPDPDNPPATPNPPPPQTEAYKEEVRLRLEARRRRPDMNRLAARMFATAEGQLGPVRPWDPASPRVVPIDLDGPEQAADATTVDFDYSPTATEPSRHITAGFGGLRRLATDGVTFTRFYATAGKCAPTRSSVMTGRHPTQVGVSDNGAELEQNELIFAGFLKAMCEDPEPDSQTPCYRTGFIGKWHLGDGSSNGARQAIWTRGIDEAFYYPGNTRFHWSTEPLSCSPQTAIPEPSGLAISEPMEGFFCSNPAIEEFANFSCIDALDCKLEVPGCEDGRCDCLARPSGDRFCYETDPKPCHPDNRTATCDYLGDPDCSSACAPDARCARWLPYVGPEYGRSVCHPKDRGNPLCCDSAGRSSGPPAKTGKYDFRRKVKPGGRIFSVDKPGSEKCDGSNALTTSTGCQYDTRVYRDMATNFIVRHGRQSSTSAGGRFERFALYVAPHATHVRRSAPFVTEAHYDTLKGVNATDPHVPEDPKSFYAVIEELDAAIGNIVSVINGFCDAPAPDLDPLYLEECTTDLDCTAGSSSCFNGRCDARPPVEDPKYGRACTSDSDCTSGVTVCRQDLKDNTLILFTADQGHTISAYGQPILREGKGSIYDGGIRVGLAAWGPGLGIERTAQPGGSPTVDSGIGSQVDLFATMVHAAGCAPTAEDGIRYTVDICDDKSRAPCDAQGPACEFGGACVSRTLEGRTLLPQLSPSIAEEMELAEPSRNLAFARYTGAGETVITRPGYVTDHCVESGEDADCAAAKVCAYVEQEAAGENPASIDRYRIGGSCETCTDVGSCGTGPDAELCVTNGQYCVGKGANLAACTDQDPASDCIATGRARCTDAGLHCAANSDCVELRLPCNACVEASWKLRASGEPPVAVELFELTSNPEEAAASNCFRDASESGPVRNLQERLVSYLNTWSSCIGSGADQGSCEPSGTE